MPDRAARAPQPDPAQGCAPCSSRLRTTCSPFCAFRAAHWSKLRSTNPLERLNREIRRRSDVVGIFPNDRSAIRLAQAPLIEQNDEWLVGRRSLSAESIALVLDAERDHTDEEVLELTAA